MRKLGLMAFGLSVLCLGACGARGIATRQPNELTRQYGNHVRDLIVNYYLTVTSINMQVSRDFSQIEAGPVLESSQEFTPSEGRTLFYVISSVDIREIHVEEYTPSRIKAVGCGILHTDHVNIDGTIINTLEATSFMNVFVFVPENDVWKLYAGYTFKDPRSDLIHWEYLNPEAREAIGNLQDYIDTYWPCGTSTP